MTQMTYVDEHRRQIKVGDKIRVFETADEFVGYVLSINLRNRKVRVSCIDHTTGGRTAEPIPPRWLDWHAVFFVEDWEK